MRSRIVGGVAFVLGFIMVIALLFGSAPIQWKPLLGGVIFIALGGYYLFTGKRAASLGEFVKEGKLSHGSAEPPKTK